MNNFMHTVMNADIPVIYRGVSNHIHVKCVIRLSVTGAVLLLINAYIVVIAHIHVRCVMGFSLTRTI